MEGIHEGGRKGGIFHPGKEIKGLRGGVHRYAAQVSPKIDAAWAEKNPFRMENFYGQVQNVL
jgi:hypothetical protein